MANDLLRGCTSSEGPTDVQADGWITHPDSRNYTLCEDSIRLGDHWILSLLWWKNEKQLLDLEEDRDF